MWASQIKARGRPSPNKEIFIFQKLVLDRQQVLKVSLISAINDRQGPTGSLLLLAHECSISRCTYAISGPLTVPAITRRQLFKTTMTTTTIFQTDTLKSIRKLKLRQLLKILH